MKNIILPYCCILLFMFFSVIKVKAQQGNSTGCVVIGHIYAEVIEVLTSTETAQLNFGRFSPETRGGKVIVNPDGRRSAQGPVVLDGGTHSSGTFHITGQYESTFSITLPSYPQLLINNSQNDKTMLVTDWESDPPSSIGAGKLNNGEMTVQVGASLIVGDLNANPKGIYAGTYAVTFAYN